MSIEQRGTSLALAFLLCCVACAAPRAERGHLEVWAVHPLPLYEGSHYALRVEDRRIIGTVPTESAPMEAWLSEDGCVNLMRRGRRAAPFCPAPPAPGPTVFIGPKGFNFATEIRNGGKTLRLIEKEIFADQNEVYADLALGDDPASEEIRRHPELLGVVVRLYGLPRSEDGKYVITRPP